MKREGRERERRGEVCHASCWHYNNNDVVSQRLNASSSLVVFVAVMLSICDKARRRQNEGIASSMDTLTSGWVARAVAEGVGKWVTGRFRLADDRPMSTPMLLLPGRLIRVLSDDRLLVEGRSVWMPEDDCISPSHRMCGPGTR